MRTDTHLRFCFLMYFIFLTAFSFAQQSPHYPAENQRKKSPGNTTYYVDPVKGNDKNSGKSASKPWRTFISLNHLVLTGGDKVKVYPGRFAESLVVMAKGSAAKQVSIQFAPGVYHFYDTRAYKTTLQISNTIDVPDGAKAIAIYITNSKHVALQGQGAKMLMHAKMLETCIENSEDVALSGLSYDYNTPTVSEFKVVNLQSNYADLKVNQLSHYAVKDSALYWQGEGWQYKLSWYWQEYNPQNGYLTRTGLGLDKARFVDLGEHMVRAYFTGNPGLKNGMVYQTRDVTRDCAGFFFNRSKNISLQNIRVYFMHGMGMVSQFCENINMNGVVVKPDEQTGRTCAAWADILHFSGCKGNIDIKNSYLSAANDDAVNVHGIHLRVIERMGANKLRVRFMHNQTYGFNPYLPGDSIELIHGNSLLPFAANVVKSSVMDGAKDVILTLMNDVPASFKADDAVENISYTPALHVSNTTITSIPTRGILATTRRKILIENNMFLRTASPAILVEDDAEGWYESGLVRHMTIRNNVFNYCGEAVITIHPENTVFDGPIHQNISIYNNLFRLNASRALYAKGTANINFSHNKVEAPLNFENTKLLELVDCTNINMGDNAIQKK